MIGYKLVPVEPTAAMIEAAREQHEGDAYLPVSLYRAMLAAAPAVQGEPVAYAVFASNGNIRVWCADPIQVETLRQQYGEALQPLYTTPESAEQQPALAKYQPCGCVICNCEHETQCQGCGAKHCGTHPIAQFSGPVYQQPAPDVAELQAELERERKRRFDGNEQASREHREDMKSLVEALELAIEYWRDRQQRYKNRKPRWVADAESALAAHRKQGGEA